VVAAAAQVSKYLNYATIIRKGPVDIITNGKRAFLVGEKGSLKRCAGQGDLLAGLTGLYVFWAA
jgi:ATP-dependent NAD(P)H-hydrate dehydratase